MFNAKLVQDIMNRHQVIAGEMGTLKHIKVSFENSFVPTHFVPVAIKYHTADCKTYADAMAKKRNLKIREDLGLIKQLIPDWYSKSMATIRNQHSITSEGL